MPGWKLRSIIVKIPIRWVRVFIAMVTACAMAMRNGDQPNTGAMRWNLFPAFPAREKMNEAIEESFTKFVSRTSSDYNLKSA